MRTNLRVLISGFGSSGQRFFSVVRKWAPCCAILVHTSQATLTNGVDSTNSVAEAAAFRPDLLVICGSADNRFQVIQALSVPPSGILIEKPFALDFDQGLVLRELLKALGSTISVGYNLRFSPSLRDFRARLQREEMGEILGVRAETGQFLPNWRQGRDYRVSVSAQAHKGGGVLRELSHELDYLRWIFGDIEWISATLGRYSKLDIDVEDTAHMTLGFAPAHQSRPFVGQLNLDFVRHDRSRWVVALCDRGSLKWDGISGQVLAYREGANRWELLFDEPPSVSTYELQWASFVDSVQRQASIAATPDEALQVLQIIEAARISDSRSGARVLTAGVGTKF